MIQIRVMTTADQEPVDRIIDDLWRDNRLMHAQYSLHRGSRPEVPGLLRRSIVAEESGAIAGAGTIFESSLHPAMYVVSINVGRPRQGQGIGACLYAHLAGLGSDRPWMVKVSAGDRQSIGFLERRGFVYATSSLIGSLDPAGPAVRAWMDTLPESAAGVRLVPLEDSPAGLPRLDMARLLYRIYARCHPWNPPGVWPDERLLEVFLGAATIPGSAVWAMEADVPLGAAVLFHEHSISRPDEAYLVHVGAVETDSDRARLLTALLVRRELECAGSRGLRIRFEADDDYVTQRGLYESAPAVDVDRSLWVMVGRPALGASQP